MYEAQWEFPEGWGFLEKNPFCGGGTDIFWNLKHTLHCGGSEEWDASTLQLARLGPDLGIALLTVVQFVCLVRHFTLPLIACSSECQTTRPLDNSPQTTRPNL